MRAAADLRFFDVLDWMLALMPTLPEDRDLRDRMARIGVRPGARLDLPAASRQPALAGMRAGMQEILERCKRVRSSGEIFGSRQFFAGDHLARATGAFLGILGNAAEEYLGVGYQADAQGRPFDGARRYTITFAPGGLPPVDAFWSITVYDADKHLYANEVDRYVISSRHIARMHPRPRRRRHHRPPARAARPRTHRQLASVSPRTVRAHVPHLPARRVDPLRRVDPAASRTARPGDTMSQTIASLIPAAIGIAISPVPIVELILVIFSRRRVPNTVAFVLTLIVLSATRGRNGRRRREGDRKLR